MANFEACITGLEAALGMRVKDLEVYEDSILIINQFPGKYGVKSLELAQYKSYLTRIY